MPKILDMPEESADLGAWLDKVIMSEELATVVDELAVLHDAGEESPTCDEARSWLGKDVDTVLQRGLAAVDKARIRQLLKRPALLPAIQELVLVSGGSYWNQFALAGNTPADPPIKPNPVSSPPARSPRWLLTLVPLAIAASFAVFVAVDSRRDLGSGARVPQDDLALTRGSDTPTDTADRDPELPWGWNRVDLMDGVDAKLIPNRLADTLNEWFRVADSAGGDVRGLRLRIDELWAGCEHVLTQSLDGLTASHQQRVRDQVSRFQEDLQEILKDVDEQSASSMNAEGVAKVKRAVDSCVRETADALRNLK